MPHETKMLPAQAVTRPPRHHYFGYYDKSPWDATGRYVLSLEVDFMDRQQEPSDVAAVGMVDLDDENRWIPLAETHAFNWQQGAMLQWLPGAADRSIIYNDVREGAFVSILRDVHSGDERVLPRPIYALSPDGRHAVTTDFVRIHWSRPGYGYCALPDPRRGEPAPDDAGIHILDLETGSAELIITYAQASRYEPRPDMRNTHHWFNHLMFSPDGSRFCFLHRWGRPGGKGWFTRFFTAAPDGSEIHLLADDDMTSHFDWRDPEHLLAWASQRDSGNRYYLFRDRSREKEIVGADVLDRDGHCSYSPDEKWILTDSYPSAGDPHRTLILYNTAANLRVDVGRFHSPPAISGPIRCDLHPRWSRDGRAVCVDSVHEESRQMYVVDVTPVTGGPS